MQPLGCAVWLSCWSYMRKYVIRIVTLTLLDGLHVFRDAPRAGLLEFRDAVSVDCTCSEIHHVLYCMCPEIQHVLNWMCSEIQHVLHGSHVIRDRARVGLHVTHDTARAGLHVTQDTARVRLHVTQDTARDRDSLCHSQLSFRWATLWSLQHWR